MIITTARALSIVEPALDADVIVNASNPMVALGSGVSGAIADACGDSFQALCRQAWEDEFDEPLTPEDCLVTPVPLDATTRFRLVLHVPSVNYRARDQETGGHTGPSRVRSCTRAAMTAFIERDEKVIGFPLLGAGHGGLSESASASAMMSAIRESVEAHPNEERRIVFAVLQPRLVRLTENAANHHRVPFVP